MFDDLSSHRQGLAASCIKPFHCDLLHSTHQLQSCLLHPLVITETMLCRTYSLRPRQNALRTQCGSFWLQLSSTCTILHIAVVPANCLLVHAMQLQQSGNDIESCSTCTAIVKVQDHNHQKHSIQKQNISVGRQSRS